MRSSRSLAEAIQSDVLKKADGAAIGCRSSDNEETSSRLMKINFKGEPMMVVVTVIKDMKVKVPL